MIQLNSNCYVDVELEGLEKLTIYHFEKLVVKETGGLGIPVFELILTQNNYSLLPFLRKANTPISITYGTSLETAKKYNFIIYNYNYVDNDEDKYSLILTGILDVKEFTNNPRIRSIEGSSSDVVLSIGSMYPLVNYLGNDHQVWIQHNNSDKNFIERVISHSFFSPRDFISGAISVDKKLIVKSIRTAIMSPPVLEFNQDLTPDENEDTLKVNFDSIKVESDSALWSGFLSEGRKLPVFNIEDRSMDLFESSTDSIIDHESNSDYSTNVNYPAVLNNGNCHEEYYQAWVDNLNFSVQFNRNNIYLFTSNRYLSSDDLTLYDSIKLILNDKYKNELVDPMSGKYLVTEKVTVITARGFGHRVRLSRDYNL